MFVDKTNKFKREYMDDIKYAVVAFALSLIHICGRCGKRSARTGFYRT